MTVGRLNAQMLSAECSANRHVLNTASQLANGRAFRAASSQRRTQVLRTNRGRPATAASEVARAAADDSPSTSAVEDQKLVGPTAKTWELDFSSRPMLDERGKKRWELLICSPDRSWQFSRYFPNNKINSSQVCQSEPSSQRTSDDANSSNLPCLCPLQLCT